MANCRVSTNEIIIIIIIIIITIIMNVEVFLVAEHCEEIAPKF
jgi:hypothetical protein